MTRRRSKLDDLDRVSLTTRAALRAWLAEHHATSPGIWLVSWKKDTGKPRIAYDDAVEELLCFGWIDSLPRTLDAERTMLLCTPRKPASAWSRLNRERVARLTAAGVMAPRGLEVVARARADGTWNALEAVDTLEVPPDLAAALAAHPDARAHFDAFPPSARRGILEWIVQARRPATRAARVAETAALAAKNRRANQWPRPA